ncbi:MAG TPA: hypothetical protein VK816_10575 [Jatrophihabitantaceae bacterium]|jgi:hypothetical protein|nr:hypothetical protein [Jatrophihabitantaceae bacterium]
MKRVAGRRGALAIAGAVVVVAVVALVVALALRPHAARPGTSPAVGTVPSAPPPVAKTFEAFSATGKPSVAVARSVRGTCFGASIEVNGPGVYRCFAGNTIDDPCFAGPSGPAGPTGPTGVGQQLVCVQDPWSQAELLTLTAALPTVVPIASTRPWALQLADGQQCRAIDGQAPSQGAFEFNFACGTGAYAVYGGNAPSGQVDLVNPLGSPPRAIAVSVIWRG